MEKAASIRSTPALEAIGISRSFRRGAEIVPVLSEVNLELNAGELVLISGVSGSGKTTLLNLLSGLDTPDSGIVHIAGVSLKELDRRARDHLRLSGIGAVFQEPNLVPDFTSRENVELVLRAAGLGALDPAREARAALAQVGLEGLEDRHPRELSGGQAQRVGIARAIAGGKPLLLADEPTGAVDRQKSTEIFHLLKEIADSGRAVLLSSHDPAARDQASRSYTLVDGRLERDL